MDRPNLPKRILGKVALGEKASFRRTFTEADVALFIGSTWDVNPYHTDQEFVQQTQFSRLIVPGLLTASLLTHLGGLWAFLATEMVLGFLKPVYVGDTITAEAEIAAIENVNGKVQLACKCINSAGLVVLTAKISGFPGKFD